ncbi:carbohydrate porin [uncultured Methylobacterium sp.]|jgi:porin|uniref:carbohydrate porin n=1 Tax=uncultured Methylobacterium sp. TaxID=157278 RepID=UPI002635186D|nr:carbohydrate porin [uncultured Methylobacterium sp.]
MTPGRLPPLLVALVWGSALALSPAPAPAQAPAPARVPGGIGLLPVPLVLPEGAGGDPRTAIGQPEVSAKRSAGEESSIQELLGPSGDPGGIRARLGAAGIRYSLTYTSGVLGNVTGGARRGAIYQGLLDGQFDADLGPLLGWSGAAFHANAYQIHGRGLQRSYLRSLAAVSGNETLPATRLFEAWIEQRLFDDRLGIRLGQLSADTEFIVSQTATLFINGTFGWPDIAGANLPSGGPAYPLATPGIRAKVEPNRNLSVQIGLYDGDPAGRAVPAGSLDPARLNRNGTNFRFHDPPLVIAEAAYAYNLDPSTWGGVILGEPGTVTLGAWHHFGRFDDLRRDSAGLPLASPLGDGVPRRLRGEDGIYAMIDQTLFREPGRDQGLSAFVRLMGSPGSASLLDLYLDAGFAYRGLLPGRPRDTAGIAVTYQRISDAARRADRDAIALTGQPQPVRDFEAVVEATYQIVAAAGLTVQPHVQYFVRPGGGIANPIFPGAGRMKNALVFGVSTAIRY